MRLPGIETQSSAGPKGHNDSNGRIRIIPRLLDIVPSSHNVSVILLEDLAYSSHGHGEKYIYISDDDQGHEGMREKDGSDSIHE